MAHSSQIGPLGGPRYAVGDVIADKYRLESVLGEGGMGTVWRALNLQLEAPVAIKLIRAELDRELLTQRLKQEARAAAKLGHPGIVRVFDVGGTQYGDPFIVMELLEGRSLAKLLVAEQRLAAVRAVQLLLPVADALSVAHVKGIIHRDLKPDNIFLAIEDERLQPKLVDFGIVKLAGESSADNHLTQAGAVLGSPEYMSPEQARGRDDLDHRTDIWSFCVVLYEALAGVTPFAAPNYNALLRSIVEDTPPSLLSYLAADESLWEIVQRGLAKDVNGRFRSMNELGRALAAWLLRQGVWEDACGGSIETKWINRTSDPFVARVSRASLSSFSGVVPESGVRNARSDHFASAPTLGAAIPSALPTIPVPDVSRGRLTRTHATLLLAAFVTLLGAAALLSAHKNKGTAQLPPTSEPIALATGASPAAPSVTPSARAPQAPAEPRAAPSASAINASSTGTPRAAPKRAAVPTPASLVSARPPAPKPTNATGDLLAPY
jgi:eukaryotic-like serine/threonine-protein kinase